MTDLEMTKLCAKAMGITHEWDSESVFLGIGHGHMPSVRYDPLHNDAQAMALVKKFGMHLQVSEGVLPLYAGTLPEINCWSVIATDDAGADNADLNRAIVETVAMMPQIKQ